MMHILRGSDWSQMHMDFPRLGSSKRSNMALVTLMGMLELHMQKTCTNSTSKSRGIMTSGPTSLRIGRGLPILPTILLLLMSRRDGDRALRTLMHLRETRMPRPGGLVDMGSDVHAGGGFEVGMQSGMVAFGHLAEGVPGGDGAEGALHVRVDDLQAVDVGGVDPAETTKKEELAWLEQTTSMPVVERGNEGGGGMRRLTLP